MTACGVHVFAARGYHCLCDDGYDLGYCWMIYISTMTTIQSRTSLSSSSRNTFTINHLRRLVAVVLPAIQVFLIRGQGSERRKILESSGVLV
jgi:hypothetical protein